MVMAALCPMIKPLRVIFSLQKNEKHDAHVLLFLTTEGTKCTNFYAELYLVDIKMFGGPHKDFAPLWCIYWPQKMQISAELNCDFLLRTSASSAASNISGSARDSFRHLGPQRPLWFKNTAIKAARAEA